MHFVADVEAILQRVSEATRGFDGEDGPRLQAATPPRQEQTPDQQVQQQHMPPEQHRPLPQQEQEAQQPAQQQPQTQSSLPSKPTLAQQVEQLIQPEQTVHSRTVPTHVDHVRTNSRSAC